LSPYIDSGLIEHWRKSGFHIYYVCQGEKVNVHTLSWVGYDYDHGDGDTARYIFDGKDIGSGIPALDKIRNHDWVRNDVLQVIAPWKIGPSSPLLDPPYRDSNLIGHYGDGNNLEAYLAKRGVKVEVLEEVE
jgi:hypothetical protein